MKKKVFFQLSAQVEKLFCLYFLLFCKATKSFKSKLSVQTVKEEREFVFVSSLSAFWVSLCNFSTVEENKQRTVLETVKQTCAQEKASYKSHEHNMRPKLLDIEGQSSLDWLFMQIMECLNVGMCRRGKTLSYAKRFSFWGFHVNYLSCGEGLRVCEWPRSHTQQQTKRANGKKFQCQVLLWKFQFCFSTQSLWSFCQQNAQNYSYPGPYQMRNFLLLRIKDEISFVQELRRTCRHYISKYVFITNERTRAMVWSKSRELCRLLRKCIKNSWRSKWELVE